MAESWAAERPKLTPLPQVLPEPFDDVGVRMVGIDCLVAFLGWQYSVPFAHIGERVEARGRARTVQILKDCRVLAVHQRHTPARLVMDPAHYDGTRTPRVAAPPPLADGSKDHGAGDRVGRSSLDRILCGTGGGRPMTAARPKLDIDTTRDRLMALGCMHAAEQLDQMLTEAVRQGMFGAQLP